MMKILKRIVSLTVIMLLLVSTVCFAAPDTISIDSQATATDLISITKPEGQKDSTFDADYVITGFGKEGTLVTIYSLDLEDNVYKKVFNLVEKTDENGNAVKIYEEASVTIGTSGLFMRTVDLSFGEQPLLVRAENGDKVQYMNIVLTRYKKNLINIIKVWAS